MKRLLNWFRNRRSSEKTSNKSPENANGKTGNPEKRRSLRDLFGDDNDLGYC